MPSVRLLVAGGHEILRIGVRAILANNPDWTVVAEASDSRQAIEKAKELRPDIAILDFSMPGTNGFDATREIVKNLPDTKVVMLTIYDGDKLIDEMQRAGAHGCLRKADVSRDLIRAITAVMKNRTFYAPETATSTLRLTTRQREIVELLAQGTHKCGSRGKPRHKHEDGGNAQEQHPTKDALPYNGALGPVCDPQRDHRGLR